MRDTCRHPEGWRPFTPIQALISLNLYDVRVGLTQLSAAIAEVQPIRLSV